MDWVTATKYFVYIVNHRSFTKAAEKHYKSPAAMSRYINWLEDHLGVKLLQRTTRSLQLTEEGIIFYERGQQLLAHLDEITQQIQAQKKKPQGTLKITLPVSFSKTILVTQLIKNFNLAYPTITLSLDFSNENRDFISDAVDIALRTFPYEKPDYSSVKIAELKLGVFAATSYLKKHGEPEKLIDLKNYNCLIHNNIGHTEWIFKNERKQVVSGNIKSNSTDLLIEYAQSGLGIIQTLESFVVTDVAKGKLKPILVKDWPKPIPIYLIYRTLPHTPLRVQTFIDFLQSHSLEEFLKLN